MTRDTFAAKGGPADLDTRPPVVRITTAGADMLKILKKLDQIVGGGWLLSCRGAPTDNNVELEVWVDGSDTVHRITLYANGQWSASTEVEV